MTEEAGRQKILVVDDDPATRFVLEDSLAEWGYDAISAVNGSDVWKVLHEEGPPPDLILLDIMMPGMDGYELCQRLKEDEKTRDIPVIFITKKTEAEDETRGFEVGALDYITKPVSLPVVRARVKNHLALKNSYKNIENLKKELENVVKRMTDIGTGLSSARDFNMLLELAISHACNITLADAGTLYIKKDNALHFKIVRNKSLGIYMGGTSEKPLNFPSVELKRSNVSAYAALEGRTVNIPDVYQSDLFDFTGPKKFDASTGYRSKSMLTVPMKNHENEVVGVFQLLNSTDPRTGEVVPFSQSHEKFAQAVASQAAVAITNVTLIHDMQNLFESFVEVMATAIDEKSPATSGHIKRMGNLTMTMTGVINDQKEGKFKDIVFSPEQLNELRIAALMHDIGKVVSPAHIMEKGKKLETIFDRAHLINTRFQYLIEKTRTMGLQRKIDLIEQGTHKEDLKKLEEETSRKIAVLSEMKDFILKCNEPKEFLEDDKIERLKTIGKLTYKDDNGVEHNYLSEDELLNLTIRKGSITEKEREIMQHHAAVTLKMLKKIPFTHHLKNIPNFAAAHHERPDGKGYPLALKEEEIPFAGLVMAVTDIAEALTAPDRPYKEAMPLSAVYKILREMGKGNELDADLVELFISKNVYGLYKEKYET